MKGHDTVSICEAADRLGIGYSTAYRQARRVTDDGGRWLTDGVRILKIAGTYRVPKAQLDAVLSADLEALAS